VFIYNDTDDVLLENLTVSGFDLGIYFGAANAPGVDSDNENKRLVLQNSNIFNNSGQGFGGSCSDCVVDHNVFTNNGYARAVLNHNIYWTGVQEDRFTTGGRITNNILTQSGITNGICQGVELVAHGNHQNLTIEGNIIYEAIGKAGVGCYGIQTNAGYTSMEYFRNLRIANNKIWNVGAEAIGASSCSDCVIENNEIVQEQPLMQIVGINIPDKTEGTIDEKSTRITIRNNSMYFNNTETATGVSLVGYIPISQANSMQGSIVTNNTIHYVGNSTTFACFKYGADVNGVVPPTYTNFDSINNNNCYGPRSIAVARGKWVYDPTGLGTPYPSWSAWNTASGFDINSTSVNPNFKSVVYPYDLSVSSSIASGIDQGDANNTAESDLLGSLRDALPDLGAYEYLLPEISTSGISEAIVNLPFFKTVFGEGGIAPYVWNFISGNLPTGITFNSENQELSGTPTSLGIFDFVLGFFDSNSPTSQQASKDFSVNVVNSLNFSINTATIPDTVVGNAYETTLSASGGEEPYIWEVVSGQLPLGINLRADGTIGGVPTEAGDFVFVVLVTEASYGSSSSKQLTLSVDGPPLIISTTTLPNGLQNANYVTSLLTGGGKPKYHWSVVSGNLPDGLILQDNGTISGIPTQIGTNTIEFSVVDANSDTITKIISISINDPLSINIQTIPDALNGSVYETDFSAINGSAPYQWAIADGALPLGLNISEEGILSGTPTQNGTFVFTVIATESSWDQTATKQMTLFVQSPVSVATSSLPNTQKNSPYSQALVAIGGTEPYNWEVAGGRLPTGLTLNSSGLIAGTSSEIGAFAFTVIVDEASYHQTSSKNLYIVVSGEIGITQSVLPNAIEYSSYATALPVAGGLAPYVWALESGALPAGLVISNDGAIGGIPTEAGTFIFTVKATESGYGSTASQQLNLTVTEAAAPTPNIQVVEKVVKKIVKVEKKSSDKPNNENVVVVTQKCISDPAQDTAVIVSEQKQNNEDSAQKENTNNTSINQNADAVRNDSWLGKIKQVIYGWYNKMVVWSFGKNN